MPFSDLIFLYGFLPILFLLYYIRPNSLWRQCVLTVFSLFFYAFGEPLYVFLMIGLVAADWGFGLLIHRTASQKRRKLWLVLAVASNLGVLVFYKYLGFLLTTVNTVFNVTIPIFSFVMPIGISFFTFQTMSYVIDVYRGDAEVQKSMPRLLLYVSLFPQLIAGPIVRYKDIEDQLDDRTVDLPLVQDGIFRFAVGLAKKIWIADHCGKAVTMLYGLPEATVTGRWMGAVFYTLQLYFDFSGYSDMAIGLGKMFGFRFLENFNYPLISSSATEFWRRWHMSLGTFFRDYVYIPLGGNRHDQMRNIFVVWFLTGLWHGAAWNFILWGLFYGVLLSWEKTSFLPFMKRRPDDNWPECPPILVYLSRIGKRILAHGYTLFITVAGFAIFYFDHDLLKNLGYLVGIGTTGFSDMYVSSVVYENLWLLLFACILACPVCPAAGKWLQKGFARLEARTGKEGTAYAAERICKTAAVLVLVGICTVMMAGNTYSAFLYFRF
ncbi:MAG: MBOAT family protein [Clostridia bacterium]|nr:MBOAT family protein [Clostridia bacterium]